MLRERVWDKVPLREQSTVPGRECFGGGVCVCVCGPTALDPPVITEDANTKQLQGHVICQTRGFYFKRTYSKRRSLKD